MNMHNIAVETLKWAAQARLDDARYRTQIAWLIENSHFYRKKLVSVGFPDAESIGGLSEISQLPLTEKDELRASRSDAHPIGRHLCVSMNDVIRIYSTSGTTGTPSYIPLTKSDLEGWIEISCRSYAASGIKPGERMVTTYNAGPFVAGATLDAFAKLGLCHIPVGSGNTERLMTAVQQLKPSILGCTPSYALHLAEWAQARDIDLINSSIKRILVAGEPGGGEDAMRKRLEEAWGAKVTEAMGIGDISISLWGECEHRNGMHFSGRGLVHFELIDPETCKPIALEDGAEGELVYTHLSHRAAPMLRFRSRDHVRISMTPCECGRTAPRVRCIGRTDDMLIVRGVNVFPTAMRQVVNEFDPHVSGVIVIRPNVPGVKQTPPLPLSVELAKDAKAPDDLAKQIMTRIRDKLIVATQVELVAHGELPRTDYKSKLVDWPKASLKQEPEVRPE